MSTISDYTKLDVSTAGQQVVVASDGVTVTVGTQSTSQKIYVLALLHAADNKNSTAIADQANQIQAKNNTSKQAAALIVALNAIDVSTGSTTNSAIYTALKAQLSTFGLTTDAQVKTFFDTATGKTLGANDAGSVSGTDIATALSNAKIYSQNLLSDGTVLQQQLANLLNNRTTFFEAMTSLIKGMSDFGNTLARNI